MTRSCRVMCTTAFLIVAGSVAPAQDLGPNFRKLKEGIYVQSAREVNSTVGIVLTTEGVVLIDTGQTLVDTRQVADAVKKLTPLPVRFVINTEVHADHTTGNFVFSPPAVVINHAGAGDAMRKANNPDRFAKADPEIKAAAEGYRLVTPHVEYQEKTTLRVGERTFELLRVRNAHSEADTAVWLPQERVLFAGSAAIPNSLNNVRPFVADYRPPGSGENAEIAESGGRGAGSRLARDDDHLRREREILHAAAGACHRDGEGREDARADRDGAEDAGYANWAYQDRMPSNIDAAYRAATGR